MVALLAAVQAQVELQEKYRAQATTALITVQAVAVLVQLQVDQAQQASSM